MIPNGQNISLIVSALKKGDERAFKTIYDTHKKSLSSFINTYTKDQAQTDDIIQETFITLWNVRKSLNEEKSIVSFLHKTAYNKFIDKCRREKREASMLEGWTYMRLMQNIDIDDDLEKRKVKILKKAIDKLPPRCKVIFMMSKFDQLKYAEIAKQLNISIKTVEAQMGKAFSIIRQEFKGKGFLNLFLTLIKCKFQDLKFKTLDF